MNEEINTLLEQIKNQYQFQNDEELKALLEGLADTESKGVTYWDYIEVDTLLSLQKTKTNYPDEVIFITYHQIHELYFKLIIQELEKITRPEKFEKQFLRVDETKRWQEGLERIIRYMNKLIESLDILKYGLDKNEFGTFRKSLLPASGFQTHQFRRIEIMLTSFGNLIKDADKIHLPKDLVLKKHFKHIYWRSGVTDQATGKPAKILVNFNAKYDDLFKQELKDFSQCNLYSRYLLASEDFRISVKNSLIDLEESILMWKMTHFRTVIGHIRRRTIGTGGTNWAKYLPLRNQKIFYFPIFWEGKDDNDINKEIKKIRKNYLNKITRELEQIL
jgi:tryptophan 2,3-dioxygenase